MIFAPINLAVSPDAPKHSRSTAVDLFALSRNESGAVALGCLGDPQCRQRTPC